MSEPNDGYLTGQLLIAMPGMADTRFARSIVYLCAHNSDEGAMGIVINQPLDLSVEEVLEHLNLSAAGRLKQMPVMAGGPVHMDRGFVLHRLLNRPKAADMMIETEAELRKVTWPSATDTWTGTLAVVVTVVVMLFYLFAADLFLSFIMPRAMGSSG